MDTKNMVKDFLGCGWKFPVGADEVTGKVRTVSYEEDIKEAIGIILMTRKGERLLRPEFGCGIQNYMFETTEPSNLIQMQQEVHNALVLWEPRITQIQVSVTHDEEQEGKLCINISYVVRATNNPYNLVFPYYINEGFGEAH